MEICEPGGAVQVVAEFCAAARAGVGAGVGCCAEALMPSAKPSRKAPPSNCRSNGTGCLAVECFLPEISAGFFDVGMYLPVLMAI